MTIELNEALQMHDLRDAIMECSSDSDETLQVLKAWVGFSEPEELIDAEFDALPDGFLALVGDAVTEAHIAGKPFELHSERPTKPIEAAKAGRVEVRTVYDEDGVKMYVSHVHGHHADWFSNTRAETAAT